MINRNRLANVSNGWQGESKRVLCVCSAGLLRSPTLAWVLSNEPFNFNTRAVGASGEYALIPLDAAHVAWADEILVMDEGQKWTVEQIQKQLDDLYSVGFSQYTPAPVTVLDVPDSFAFRDPVLVNLLFDKALSHFMPEEE